MVLTLNKYMAMGPSGARCQDWACRLVAGSKLLLLLLRLYSVDDGMLNDCGAVGGIRIGRGSLSTVRKPAPVPRCPQQAPHDPTWNTTTALRQIVHPTYDRAFNGLTAPSHLTQRFPLLWKRKPKMLVNLSAWQFGLLLLSHRYQFDRKISALSRRFGEEKNVCTCLESKPGHLVLVGSKRRIYWRVQYTEVTARNV
jgi:hypothetical protein